MLTAIDLTLVDDAILLIYFGFVLGIGFVLKRSMRGSGEDVFEYAASAGQLRVAGTSSDAIEFAALAAGGYAEKLINQAIDIGDRDPPARKALAGRAGVVFGSAKSRALVPDARAGSARPFRPGVGVRT